MSYYNKYFDYKEACDYLDKSLIFGIKPSLVRINKILDLLDNPQNGKDFIHIVGTNGKTSTAKITASILNKHGLKAGYYISPHIYSYTERISIAGKDVSEDDFAEVFNDIFPLILEVNKLGLDGEMTQFEILTAMLFKLVKDKKTDVMVLEAGMGGRWDATNAANAKVVGLTGVSLEHTQILGKTISKIAEEKSEVIKNNSLVASMSMDKKVNSILFKKVETTGSKLFLFGKDFFIKKIKQKSLEGFTIDLKGIFSEYNDIYFPIVGDYQKKNLLLAVVLSELYLNTYSRNLRVDYLNDSLNYTNIFGRFQILRKEPIFIVDASHNPEGVSKFIKNLNTYFPENKKIIIFSVLKDKNYKKMLEYIIKNADMLILTSSNSYRSLSIKELEKATNEILSKVRKNNEKYPVAIASIDNIENSIKYSLNLANKNDIISLTGSITNLEFVKSTNFC